MNTVPPYPGAPRWVKVSLVVTAIVALAFAFLLHDRLMGRHGSGQHSMHGPASVLHADPSDGR